MRRALLLFAFLSALSTAAFAAPIRIGELKTLNPTAGEFTVEGFVIVRSDCSCPEGAHCDPCPPDFIVISETDEIARPAETEHLTVFTKDPKAFYSGEKYRFTVKFTEKKLFSSEAFNDAHLVSSESVYHVNA